jgi:hypothetical protein
VRASIGPTIPRACGSLCLLLLAVGAASDAAGADLFVAAGGDDHQRGSQKQPFREIRAAISVARPGDTIHVGDGSYLGFDIERIAATAAAPLIIRAEGDAAVVTATSDRGDNRDTIRISECAFVTIDHLHSYHAHRAGCRVDHSPDTTIVRCTFGGCAVWGLFTDFSDRLRIERNTCYGSVEQHGCYVSNSCTSPVVRANIFNDNAGCGLHMNGDAHQGGPGLIRDALVEDNVIFNNGTKGGSGINCDGVVDGVFRDNLIYSAHASGLSLYRIDAAGPSTHALIVGNTILVAKDGRWAINISNDSTGAILYDNILLNDNPRHGSIAFDGTASIASCQCDHNVLCGGGIVATTDGGDSVLSFAKWQALGFDAHSGTASVSDLFRDAEHADFTLLPGSTVRAGGVSHFAGTTAPRTNLLGKPRGAGQGYSIGAY